MLFGRGDIQIAKAFQGALSGWLARAGTIAFYNTDVRFDLAPRKHLSISSDQSIAPLPTLKVNIVIRNGFDKITSWKKLESSNTRTHIDTDINLMYLFDS
jgi:hypothetical protein